LASRHGEKEIPKRVVDLDPDEEAEALAILDTTTGMAVPDGAKLAELVARVKTQSPGVQAVLDRLKEQAEWAIAAAQVPDFQPVGIETQPRLDQKSPVTCPECGNEFVPT
jgi:hypothetical protein